MQSNRTCCSQSVLALRLSGGAVVARGVHIPEVEGSNPSPTTDTCEGIVISLHPVTGSRVAEEDTVTLYFRRVFMDL